MATSCGQISTYQGQVAYDLDWAEPRRLVAVVEVAHPASRAKPVLCALKTGTMALTGDLGNSGAPCSWDVRPAADCAGLPSHDDRVSVAARLQAF